MPYHGPMSGDRGSASRRAGDTVAIPGDYQHRALHDGWAAQRYWHHGKLAEAERLLAPRSGDVILDAGCGSGVLAGRLGRSRGVHVVGVDGNPAAVGFARSQYGAPNVEFCEGLVDELDLADRRINKIAFLEVIEHVYPEQAEATLRCFRALLPPGGRLVVSTPNSLSPWPLIEFALDRSGLAPQLAEEQHVASYTRRSLCRLGERCGLRVVEARTIHFLAPWLAPIGWPVAAAAQAVERVLRTPFGALAMVAFERP